MCPLYVDILLKNKFFSQMNPVRQKIFYCVYRAHVICIATFRKEQPCQVKYLCVDFDMKYQKGNRNTNAIVIWIFVTKSLQIISFKNWIQYEWITNSLTFSLNLMLSNKFSYYVGFQMCALPLLHQSKMANVSRTNISSNLASYSSESCMRYIS